MTRQGFGQEGGRKRIGPTHTIDINGIVRTFSSVPKGGAKILEYIIQTLESISEVAGLGSESSGVNPYIEKFETIFPPDTVEIAGYKKTVVIGHKMFVIDRTTNDTTKLINKSLYGSSFNK